jgi:DNA-binding CsgD family transcriptional regulator
MIYIIPAFLYNFLKIKWSTKLSVIFLSLSIFYFLIGILAILVTNKLYILSVVLFYSIMVYLFIVGIKNYKNIAEASAKFILKILSFISFITLVLAITQFFKSSSIDIYDNFNIIDIIFLLSYLWFNIVMLSYFFWYFLNIISKKNIAVSMKSGENNYIEVLTKREKEITNYLLEGKSNKEVSIILHISLNTVNNHVSKIYEKINVKNRVEFVNKFIK